MNYILVLFFATPSLHLYASTTLHLYASTTLHLYASTTLRLYNSTPLHRASTTLRLYTSTSLHLYSTPDVTVPFLGQQLRPVSSAKDLGVILDSGLTFNDHISSLSSSLLFSLCQISRIRHLFSKEVLYIMINSIVFSKLFYCSAVWSGTYKQNIHKLQLLQKFAAHILTETKKFDHITPVLKTLGWLTIEEQLWLRDVTMMYKCVNNLVPAYISCKIGKRSNAHNLCNSEDLNLPECRTAAAQRGFFYRAAKAWNSLNNNTRTAQSLRSFNKVCKGRTNEEIAYRRLNIQL